MMGKGDYEYSGSTVPTRPYTDIVRSIQDRVEAEAKCKFDYVLINGYHGTDKVGWHQDNEPTIDQTKPIASVSFGGSRDFDVCRAGSKSYTLIPKWRISLNNGDLVIMVPGVQDQYYHQVPPRTTAQRRFNLTFRCLHK